MKYTLIRKRNKKAYLRVKDGAVIVTAPFRMPQWEIDEFVNNNKGWILKALKKEENKRLLENGCTFQVLNETYKLIIDSNCKRSSLQNHVLTVKNENSLKRYLTKWFESIVYDRFKRIEKELQIYGYTLKFGFYKSKWGSCTPAKKLITLNVYLLFTDFYIIDAIIYHEFCHTIHMNHSTRFYNQLLTWYPEYHFHHNRLKKMNIPRLQ